MLCFVVIVQTNCQGNFKQQNLNCAARKVTYNSHLNSEKSYFQKETKFSLYEFTFYGTTNVDRGKQQPL